MTPTLSIAAFHDTVTDVWPALETTSAPGVVGALVSVGDVGVVGVVVVGGFGVVVVGGFGEVVVGGFGLVVVGGVPSPGASPLESLGVTTNGARCRAMRWPRRLTNATTRSCLPGPSFFVPSWKARLRTTTGCMPLWSNAASRWARRGSGTSRWARTGVPATTLVLEDSMRIRCRTEAGATAATAATTIATNAMTAIAGSTRTCFTRNPRSPSGVQGARWGRARAIRLMSSSTLRAPLPG